MATGKPGAVFLREQLDPPHHAIVALQGNRVLGVFSETVRGDLPQELHGVVPCPFPETAVDTMEQLPRVELPAPPQVLADVGQQPDAFRESIGRRSWGRTCGRRRRVLGWWHWVRHI